MRLTEARYDNRLTGCCAELDVARWDGGRVTWKDKPFVRDHVRSFLHLPLNFGAVMKRDHAAIEAATAYPEEPLWLSDEVSPWRSDLYVAVDRDVPGTRVERLSGTFLTKVFEGPYRDAREWMRAMEDYVHGKGEEVEKMYIFYATCPKCAKRLGKNQVVLFAKLSEAKAAVAA